ncbi:MAG: hypothetical protein M3457_14435 [Chloroflexota bacterium]|nr:hypothetical protein [Chloroflexota bacterium]
MHKIIPAFPRLATLTTRSRSLIVASAVALLCASPAPILAAPGQSGPDLAAALEQNVDYIGADAGAALDLDFPVLVPSWVPGPFGGSPSIDSGGGYYSLYWMNGGGEPTFLQVTGQVGGALPAGSPYDLNVQLFINSSVQGYGAIHDVTPAYDTVWWIAGGVLYKVESRNSSTDSVTLANSLITFVPPSAPEPEPEPEPTSPPPVAEDPDPEVEQPDPVTSAPGSNSGGSTTLPADESETSGPELADDAGDPESDEVVDEASTSAPDPTVAAGEAPTESESDTPEETPVASDGTGDTLYSSDGTGGAQNLVVVGDGTGGTIDVIIPRQPTGQPSP